MDDVKCPQIESLQKITASQAADYIRFVSALRHNQRRYFATRYPALLDKCRDMEKQLDALNAELLNPTPKLF